MDKYHCYIQNKVRKVIAEITTLDRAIDFLKEHPRTGVVHVEMSLEELKHAKSIRSPNRTESDNSLDQRREVSEDSYRKLLGSLGDNTE
jgi:FtsZ-binding cell division protein ZapB